MQKFQLIKEYPGSPKLGTIVVQTELQGDAGYIYLSQEEDHMLPAMHVEGNEEYWKQFNLQVHSMQLMFQTNRGKEIFNSVNTEVLEDGGIEFTFPAGTKFKLLVPENDCGLKF